MKRRVHATTDIDSDRIKEWISSDVLNIQDKGLEIALRRILFNPNNKIDWQDAVKQIEDEMPEAHSRRLRFMKKVEGASSENNNELLDEETRRILRNADTSDWAAMQTEHQEEEIRRAGSYANYIAHKSK